MKLSKLQQKAKLAVTTAEEAKTRSSAAGKALEQVRERLRKAKLDLKNDRRSRSSVSLNLRWCSSNSGQFLSSPAHIVSLLVERLFKAHD